MLWRYERMASAMGYQVVAGVDEVGMGPLAGPVVGGAVVLPIGIRIPGLDDSKLLTADQRERLDRAIRRRAMAVSVCAVDHAQVDSLGLLRARHLATAGAVAGLKMPAEYLLVDAWDVPDAMIAQMAVVRGIGSAPRSWPQASWPRWLAIERWSSTTSSTPATGSPATRATRRPPTVPPSAASGRARSTELRGHRFASRRS